MGKTGKVLVFYDYAFARGLHAAQSAFSRGKLRTRWEKTSSCDDGPSISAYNKFTVNPLRVGQDRIMQMAISKISDGFVV